jgi:conjugal transfer/entry exclusion protein
MKLVTIYFYFAIDEVITTHGEVFCKQLKQIVEQVKTLIENVDEIKPRMNKIDDLDSQRKQFDYRLTYLESVSKNIVTQFEYRNDTLKFEESLLQKTTKTCDTVLEEMGKQKDYVDQQVSLFQDKVNDSEMKTI